jgi:small-conductance mechanosensitive channel
MKKIVSRLLLIICFLMNTQLNGFFDLSKIFGSKTIEINFPTDIESKTKQLNELEKFLETFKAKKAENDIVINKKLNDIDLQITKSQSELKSIPKTEADQLNTKISILNQRKQNLLKSQELSKDTEILINNHIKAIKEIIENLKTKFPQQELKSIYSWQDFNLAQIKLSELKNNLEMEKNKKDDLSKQKLTIKENLIATQKDKELLEEKRKSFLSKKNDLSQESNLEIEAENLDQKILLTNEKIDFLNLTIEKIDQEIKQRETNIENLKALTENAQKEFLIIEKRSIINDQDVKKTKTELEKAQQEFSSKKDELDKVRAQRKSAQETLIPELEKIKEQTKKLKVSGETANRYLIETKEQKLEQHNLLLDKTIRLIDAETERRENFVKTKQIEYEIIDAYHKIGLDKENAINLLTNFKNQKETIGNTIRGIQDKQKAIQNESIEISRNQDSLAALAKRIEGQKNTLFKASHQTYIQVIKNISLTKKFLAQQSKKNQQYHDILSKLITQQEKHLSQYDFVIKDLETKYVTFSIWKRSPKAISFEELAKAYAQTENFFKKLFWDTPKYIGASSIIKSVGKMDSYDYISLFLFALFFAMFFLILKILLKKFHANIKSKFISEQSQQIYKYSTIFLDSFIGFILNNFTLLFSWLFIYAHIIFDFKYIFSFISPLVNSYSVTIFYLISIPILIYIFTQFVSEIKILNNKFSSALFTEKSQYKFTLLLNTFLYAPAILLPFKQAFLEYITTPSVVPNVILAAYSLILLVVILLFFWKEDVLALIPSEHKFFIWLKSKIAKYYYSAFIFIMSLFILANPYIGYSNLSWYLAFAIPVSTSILVGMFFVHYYLRKYSMHFFLEEEEEEVKDKFEHSKTYYGFFIISTFCVLLFFSIVLMSKIWGLDYTPTHLWKILSQDWVISLGADTKLGVAQIIILTTFIASGFLFSSLVHKFVLTKLFNIFKTEPGMQNTISKIFHYITISMSLVFGFATIQLVHVTVLLSFLLLGLGFALKDFIADFIAGFLVLIERPIEIGNYIEIDEKTKGTVHKISARSTTLRTGRNYSIVIPNKDLVSKPIVNCGIGRLAVGFELNILVDYAADPELVKKLLVDTIQKHPLVLKIPAVMVRLEDFKDDGLLFFVRAFTSSRRVRDQKDVASDLRLAILKIFKENKIQLAFPQRIIHFAPEESGQKTSKVMDIKFDQSEEK